MILFYDLQEVFNFYINEVLLTLSVYFRRLQFMKVALFQVEAGKSPLAMLAKTCETIGLPDTSSKKSISEKKDDGTKKGAESPTERRKERSPRTTPATNGLRGEATSSTSTFPGLSKPPQTTFPPLGFSPTLPFPFPYAMMPYAIPFPSFAMPFTMTRPPCPSMLLQRPCVTPGCTSCSPDMLSSFATHPLFSTYSSMPSVSSSPILPGSYQNFLISPTTVPSTSNSTTSSSSSGISSKSTTSQQKHICSWVESTGICGKQFVSADDLALHVKQFHTPSPPSSASSATADVSKTPQTRPNLPRYHPYSKPNQLPISPMMSFPSALQAMYAQRLMSGMPHP
uniref:C2H2-type domain-containing protein n=1 Tax=Angiostrongylus cantonensis TaxID=6313 RepID=A0A0K0DIF2_ANGCA